MVYMYVRFHPYTSILYMIRKTYLMILVHVFKVLFLSKLIFELNIKNIDISFICVLDSIYTSLEKKSVFHLKVNF